MGFLDRFNTKTVSLFKDTDVVSVVKGTLIDASQINDPLFSQEIMGQTIGFQPENGHIVCPVNGKVTAVFPTGHAFGITTKAGVGYLVHMGIDTVNLGGKGFKMYIKENEEVIAGQKAAKMDLNLVRNEGLDTTIVLVVTEKQDENFRVNYIECQKVEKGQLINR